MPVAPGQIVETALRRIAGTEDKIVYPAESIDSCADQRSKIILTRNVAANRQAADFASHALDPFRTGKKDDIPTPGRKVTGCACSET
ncbi:hypothetical protein NKI19_01305 [Mesorhizobium sp. M0751]